jgi:hypothetical protein
MREILAPALLTVIGAIGVNFSDVAADLYLAAYPKDLRYRQAIEHCVAQSPAFNRLNSADRAACYAEIGAGPSIGAEAGEPRQVRMIATGVSPDPAARPNHQPGYPQRPQASAPRPAGRRVAATYSTWAASLDKW